MKNLKRLITTKETDLVIQKLYTKKTLETDGSIGKFYQPFKEES